jgi:transcriptional regulator with XRE-family HTH domain
VNQDSDSTQPRSILKYFGAELQRLREHAEMTQAELAKKLCYSVDLLRSVEQGRRVPSLRFAEQCDELLENDGALTRLWQLVHAERLPSWLLDYVGMEQDAVGLRFFETQCIPGLLQTEAYMRAMLSAGRARCEHDLIEELVSVRLRRQEALRREQPPHIWAIIDESVLTRPVGGRDVMNHQLRHLAESVDPPAIVVQVLPCEAYEQLPLTGAFFGLCFRDSPDVYFIDAPVGSGHFITDPDRVSRCTVNFDLLRAAALPAAASVTRIIEAIKEA